MVFNALRPKRTMFWNSCRPVSYTHLLSYPLLEGCVAWVIVRSRIPGFRLWQGIDTAWCGTFGTVVTLGAGAVPVQTWYLHRCGLPVGPGVGLMIAYKAENQFCTMVGIGIMAQIAWQVFCNIAVVTNTCLLYTSRTLDTAMCAEVRRKLTLRLLSGDGESLDAVDTSSEAYQTQYQKVYDALSKMDTKYQVLATKVNNAVKLSIESYVSQFNKAHKRATETSRKGNISVGSEKSFQRNYPYGAFAAAVLGFTDADGIGTYGLEKSYQSTLAGVDGRTITPVSYTHLSWWS